MTLYDSKRYGVSDFFVCVTDTEMFVFHILLLGGVSTSNWSLQVCVFVCVYVCVLVFVSVSLWCVCQCHFFFGSGAEGDTKVLKRFLLK